MNRLPYRLGHALPPRVVSSTERTSSAQSAATLEPPTLGGVAAKPSLFPSPTTETFRRRELADRFSDEGRDPFEETS